MPTSRTKVLADPRSGARPLGNSDPGPSYESRGSESKSKPPAPQRQPARQSKPSSPASAPATRPAAAKSPGRPKQQRSPLDRTARTGRQFTAPEFHNYQGIILAEFVLAELLVAGTPIATRQGQPGLSPYVPRDMTKLLSLGMVYFLLELLAIGGPKAGRLSAWFGGLILIVVGMNEAANVSKVLDIFGGGKDSQPADTGGSQNG